MGVLNTCITNALLQSCLDLMKAAEITDVSQQPQWKDFTPNHYLLFGCLCMFHSTEAPQDSYLNRGKGFLYNAKANANAKQTVSSKDDFI